MGDMADDLAYREWQENSRWHGELNPRGIKTPDDFVWTTKDGKRLKLRDMETSHIENCIKMLERSLSDWDYELEGFQGGYTHAVLEAENEKKQEFIGAFKLVLKERHNE